MKITYKKWRFLYNLYMYAILRESLQKKKKKKSLLM